MRERERGGRREREGRRERVEEIERDKAGEREERRGERDQKHFCTVIDDNLQLQF